MCVNLDGNRIFKSAIYKPFANIVKVPPGQVHIGGFTFGIAGFDEDSDKVSDEVFGEGYPAGAWHDLAVPW
jgi:hypothetical protein